MQLEGRATVADRDRDRATVAHGLAVGGENRAVRGDETHPGQAEGLSGTGDQAGTVLSPRSTLPATVASSSASAVARRAERARRAAWSTTVLTSIAMTTYNTSAIVFAGC